MKLAIMSDSHDNIWKLEDSFPILMKADAVIHCGDLCAPFVLKQLAEALPQKPVHVVWGNNDGDTFLMAEVAKPHPSVHLHGDYAELQIGGLKVAINHYPTIAKGLALSGQYDLVCYGHDHEAHESWFEDCQLLNPGELMGMNGRSSLALLDAESREVEFIDV